MFDKIKLKSQIKKCKKTIEEIEHKRYRSQANLVEAILTQQSPNDDDVDYFNRYTAQIDETRDKMHQLQNQLDALNA